MKKMLFVLVTVAALILTACGGGGGGAAGPIKIGGGFALTGAESALDLPAANGAKLAVKEINAAGGVLGRQIDFIIHDSKYDMTVTAQTAKQFVEQDKVIAVVGYTDSDSILASGPIIQGAGLPFVSVGATSPKLPTQIGDLLFLASFGDNVQAAAGAEYAFKNFGPKAYLLWDKGVEYTTLLGGYFKARFAELGGEIVLEDTYEDNATDFSAQITKVKALPEQPDFYYISAMPYNVGPAVKQFRDAGLTGPIVGGDGYDTPDIISVAGEAANGVWFSTHALIDPTGGTQGIKNFIAAYKAEYGNDPENAFAALGYDAVYLLADAIKRAGSTDAQAIKKALESTSNFPGITGAITLTADAHVPRKGVTLIKIDGGKFTLGAEVVPDKVPAP
jgi:branched-chain amino acid transport system substrate-binding protein